MSKTPVSLAQQRAGISVPSLAAAAGISEAACWDLLNQPREVSMCLTLRQLAHLASALGVLPLSLVPDATSTSERHRTLAELADAVRDFCAGHHLSVDQFGERAGWDVRRFRHPIPLSTIGVSTQCVMSARLWTYIGQTFSPMRRSSSNQAMEQPAIWRRFRFQILRDLHSNLGSLSVAIPHFGSR